MHLKMKNPHPPVLLIEAALSVLLAIILISLVSLVIKSCKENPQMPVPEPDNASGALKGVNTAPHTQTACDACESLSGANTDLPRVPN